MGTNYYYKNKPQLSLLWRGKRRLAPVNICAICAHSMGEAIHIGKSSMGWCFALHVTDEIKSLEDWKLIWAKGDGIIEDEYGEKLTPEEMLRIITERGDDNPNNLYRKKIGAHCIGHGEGTWDLVPGSFS